MFICVFPKPEKRHYSMCVCMGIFMYRTCIVCAGSCSWTVPSVCSRLCVKESGLADRGGGEVLIAALQ